MAEEAIKTSAIEGELLSRKDVMSSIRRNLGLDAEAPGGDKRAAGAAALMIDVRNSFAASLSEEMLFGWHPSQMSNGRIAGSLVYRTRNMMWLFCCVRKKMATCLTSFSQEAFGKNSGGHSVEAAGK